MVSFEGNRLCLFLLLISFKQIQSCIKEQFLFFSSSTEDTKEKNLPISTHIQSISYYFLSFQGTFQLRRPLGWMNERIPQKLHFEAIITKSRFVVFAQVAAVWTVPLTVMFSVVHLGCLLHLGVLQHGLRFMLMILLRGTIFHFCSWKCFQS